MQNLSNFLERIYQRLQNAIDNSLFHPTQRQLLQETVDACHKIGRANPINHLLSIFYLIIKAWRDDFNEQAEELGVFCFAYILAADLADDVHDDDLTGKAHETAGAAIASNNAFTFLFLGLQALQRAIELEPDVIHGLKYLKIFNRYSILAASGQHRDLLGMVEASTPNEVLAMQKAKTSSLSMVAECAAIYAGCSQDNIARYCCLSEKMVQLVQVIDDVRDIYGKKLSPDLVTDKLTYPLSCFLEVATSEQKNHYQSLRGDLPDSLEDIQRLLYEVGVIQRSAETVEQLRLSIHDELAATGNDSAAHRNLLLIVDTAAAALYPIQPVASTQFIQQPNGVWHRQIRQMAADFQINMRAFNPPPFPTFLPWHLPQWMYDFHREAIYYPDLEGQAEEIVPQQAALMGIDDLATAQAVIAAQAPIVLTHELFHFWRDASGNMTTDFWFEEWAANRLAVAYVKKFHPDLVFNTLEIARQVVARHADKLTDTGRRILEKFDEPGYGPSDHSSGYGVDLTEMAIIQMAMIQKLYAEELSLEQAVFELLGRNNLSQQQRELSYEACLQ